MTTLLYIIIATLINADTIAWGISEYDNPVKGVFAGVIEYSDNWYGEPVQDVLIEVNSWWLYETLPDNSISFYICPFIRHSYSLPCLYVENGSPELSEWKG